MYACSACLIVLHGERLIALLYYGKLVHYTVCLYIWKRHTKPDVFPGVKGLNLYFVVWEAQNIPVCVPWVRDLR